MGWNSWRPVCFADMEEENMHFVQFFFCCVSVHWENVGHGMRAAPGRTLWNKWKTRRQKSFETVWAHLTSVVARKWENKMILYMVIMCKHQRLRDYWAFDLHGDHEVKRRVEKKFLKQSDITRSCFSKAFSCCRHGSQSGGQAKEGTGRRSWLDAEAFATHPMVMGLGITMQFRV